MGWQPKVNRHVQVMIPKTATYQKVRSGIITGFAADSNPIIRVGHHSEVYGNATVGVPRMVDPDENLSVVKYVSW